MSLAAPSLSSPILNTFTFSAAVLFRGSLTFFMPLLTRVPLLAHLSMLALPPGPLGPCLLCPLLLPLACSPPGGPRWFALAMAGCPLLPATSGPPRPCPPVAERPADGHICGGFCHIASGGAHAPRQDGGGPPGPSLARTSSPLGLWAALGAIWALPLSVPARAPL